MQTASTLSASRPAEAARAPRARRFAAAWAVAAGAAGGAGLAALDAPPLVAAGLTAGLVFAAVLATARQFERHGARLRQRERQLAEIIDTASDGIVTVDARHRVVLFNRAAGQVFGIAPGEAIGQPVERFVPERERAAHAGRLDRFARSDARRRTLSATLLGLRADGREVPLQASMSRLGEGEDVLLTVVVRDASAQQETERARRAQEVAEAASRAKTEFLARMSHELRTPLNAILGFSQLLLTQPDPPLREPQARQARHIVDAGWHLLALVNDLLDVSRIETGALRMECAAVDLRRLVDESWHLVEKEAQRHEVALALPPAEGPVWVCADALRLRQVLVNLLSNAVKYNRPGGRVGLAFAAEGGYVALQVDDTGIGMTQEQLAHLYEPFNRLGQERGSVDGSGIGLALSRQLVQAMDGELHVESRAGAGTCVRLRLPATQAPARDDDPRPLRAAQTSPGPRSP